MNGGRVVSLQRHRINEAKSKTDGVLRLINRRIKENEGSKNKARNNEVEKAITRELVQIRSSVGEILRAIEKL